MTRTTTRGILIAVALVVQDVASRASSIQDPPHFPAAVLQTIVTITGEFPNGPIAGAGLVFGGDRKRMFVVTADHLVRRRSGDVAGNLEVRFHSRAASPLLARFTGHGDPELDVAVLVVEGLEEHGVSFCDQPFGWFAVSVPAIRTVTDAQRRDAVRRGAPVYPIGHPNGRRWTVPVVADRIVDTSAGLIVFQSSVISEGHSGGALLSGRGEIVGLIQAHEPPFGRATSIATLVDSLQSWGYHVAAHWPEAVHRAAEDGNLDELRGLLIAGGCAVVDELDQSGWTPLQLAASRGERAVAALLLEHGADVARRNEREPALFRAAAWNQPEIVALLLAAGADVNQPEGGGKTPLFAAAIARSAEMVRRLLAAGADVNHRDLDGETPLMISIRRSDVPVARLLIAAGADVNVRSRWQVSVLSLVEERRTREQKDLYKLLVDKGAVR